MRFLKRQTINRRQLKSTTVYSDVDDANVYINPRNSGSMVLPSGTNAQEPTPGINGMMRYNVDDNEVQVCQDGIWRSLRFKEHGKIIQQDLGAGDGEEVYFGPLSSSYNPDPSYLSSNIPTSGGRGVGQFLGQNLLVVVENVLQLSGANYTVEQNPTIGAETYSGANSAGASTGATTLYFNSALTCSGASGDGTTVTLTFTNGPRPAAPFAVGSSIIVTGFTPAGYNGTYTVTACTNSSVSYLNTTTATMTVAGTAVSAVAIYPSTNFSGSTITGSASLLPNTIISSFVTDADTDAIVSVTINQALSGNISADTALTITESVGVGSGYYLKFSSPVPYGKIVTVLHGFDK